MMTEKNNMWVLRFFSFYLLPLFPALTSLRNFQGVDTSEKENQCCAQNFNGFTGTYTCCIIE